MAVAAVAAVAGGVISSQAAGKAAKQQAAGQAAAQKSAEEGFADIKGQLNPYMEIGKQALPLLSSFSIGGPGGGPNAEAMMSALEQYPGYQFAIGQARKSLDANAAKLGSRVSGNQLQGAMDYAVESASGLFDKYLGNLTNLTTIGQNATNTYTAARGNMSQQVQQAQVGAANARASGTVGKGNAWANTASQIGKIAGGAAGGAFGAGAQSMMNAPVSSLWSSSAPQIGTSMPAMKM